jgi:hypothetical protein
MATEQQQLLAQLAQRLRRPVQGMAAFEALSAEQIQQLMGYISLACEREQTAVREDLRQSLPKPLRWMVAKRWGGAL